MSVGSLLPTVSQDRYRPWASRISGTDILHDSALQPREGKDSCQFPDTQHQPMILLDALAHPGVVRRMNGMSNWVRRRGTVDGAMTFRDNFGSDRHVLSRASLCRVGLFHVG